MLYEINMTEWYYGHDGGDLLVREDDAYFDRLPSPDTWLQWETCGTAENSGWSNSSKTQQRPLFSRPGNTSYNSSDFRPSSEDSQSLGNSTAAGRPDFGASSEDSRSLGNSAAGVRADYYFNELTGPDSADDLFLSSLLHDEVLPLQSLYIAVPSDSDSAHKMMDFPSISCDTNGTSRSHVSEPSSRNSSDYCFDSSVKVLETKDLVRCDNNTSEMLEFNSLSSLEESMLNRLENVLNQFNDKTRICVRDSLYRLAKNSALQTSRNDLVDGFCLNDPSLPGSKDASSRSRVKEVTEPRTNAIDRTVAYLMFSKVDANVQASHHPELPPGFAHSDTIFTATTACEDLREAAVKTSDLLVQCEVPVFSQQRQSQ